VQTCDDAWFDVTWLVQLGGFSKAFKCIW